MAVIVVERFKQESMYRLSEKVVVTERCRCGEVALRDLSEISRGEVRQRFSVKC